MPFYLPKQISISDIAGGVTPSTSEDSSPWPPRLEWLIACRQRGTNPLQPLNTNQALLAFSQLRQREPVVRVSIITMAELICRLLACLR